MTCSFFFASAIERDTFISCARLDIEWRSEWHPNKGNFYPQTRSGWSEEVGNTTMTSQWKSIKLLRRDDQDDTVGEWSQNRSTATPTDVFPCCSLQCALLKERKGDCPLSPSKDPIVEGGPGGSAPDGQRRDSLSSLR